MTHTASQNELVRIARDLEKRSNDWTATVLEEKIKITNVSNGWISLDVAIRYFQAITDLEVWADWSTGTIYLGFTNQEVA